MTLLQPGDAFPALSITVPGGEALALPGAIENKFGVVLFFRGEWCPFCNAQLRAFEQASDKFAELDIGVVALSVDDEDTTKGLIQRHHLRFPVGHSADAQAIAEATGAFINEDPTFLQSTGFVLNSDGQVLVSVYSSGAIGRLVPEDVMGLVRFITSRPAGA